MAHNRSLQSVQKVDTAKLRTVHALIQKANTSAKKTVIDFADNVGSVYALRRPTGIMDLDVDLCGGFPAGTLNIISGPDGAGKTALLFMAMAMQQRIYGPATLLGLAPIENRVDHFFMRECGMQVAVPDDVIEQKQEGLRALQLPTLSKEDIKALKRKVGELVLVHRDTAEATLDEVQGMVETQAFSIIGVDSFSAFLTDAEANTTSLEDNPRQAAMASALTRFTQRLGPTFAGLDRPNTTTILGVCQVRANRERANMNPVVQKFVAPYIPSIPYALKHFMTISLLIYPGEKVKTGKKGEAQVQVGKEMKWRTDKGKAGVHEGITGSVEYTFNGGIDTAGSVFALAFAKGILIEKDGMVSVKTAKGTMLWEKIGTKQIVLDHLKTDVEFEMRIRLEVLKAANKECIYW